MDGFSYQPPLLSLQDMLNLSDEDDGNYWTSNPYNISHYFEPISPTKLAKQEAVGTGAKGQEGTSSQSIPVPGGSGVSATFTCNVSSGRNADAGACLDDIGPSGVGIKVESHIQAARSSSNYTVEPMEEEMAEEVDLDILFEETAVSSAVNEFESSAMRPKEEKDDYDLPPQEMITTFRVPPMISPMKDSPRRRRGKRFPVMIKQEPTDEEYSDYEIPAPVVRPFPRLVEVDADKVKGKKESDKQRMKLRQKYDGMAVKELNTLILKLQCYCGALKDFLDNEGLALLEEYDAQVALERVCPELINYQSITENPCKVAHAVTKAVVDRVRGQTALKNLPRTKPLLWRSSDLIVFQQSILESVLHHRQFMLNCRYTELLTEMGFDPDELDKLSKCTNMVSELTTIGMLMEDHKFQSKLKSSTRNPIQTVVLRVNPKTGEHRAFSLPSPELLVKEKWKLLGELKKNTLVSNIAEKDIDWLFVLKKMYTKLPRLKLDEEACKLTYSHLVDPKVNNAVWHADELIKLAELRKRFTQVPWARIAEFLGTKRTPFSCFLKYKLYCMPTGRIHFSRRSLRVIDECTSFYRGNAVRAESELFFELGQSLRHRGLLITSHRRLNARIKKGKFSVVEDALLLVTMEKYKDQMFDSNVGFKPVGYTLPWRYTTMWKMRFDKLMTKFYFHRWSKEEDSRLINLVKENGPKYKVIQRDFPHKNRKQCRSRYTRIMKALNSYSITLEEYHILFKYTRGSLHLKELNNIAQHLEMAIRSKQAGNTKYIRQADLEFLKIRRTPTDATLEGYLLTFSTDILCAAMDRLLDCLLQILEKCEEHIAKATTLRLPSTDRRRFNTHCAASIASALHLRNVKLSLQQQTVGNLTDFEREIYKYYERFSVKGAMKKNAQRCGVPSAELLEKLPSIQNIIVKSSPSLVAIIEPVGGPQELDKGEKRLEAEFFAELEDKRKGGALKGRKKRSTLIREERRRAAMLRWKKKPDEMAEDNHPLDQESVPESPASIFSDFPGTPATPASMTSVGSVSQQPSGTTPAVCLAAIADHAYIRPMDSPAALSCMSLPQLFLKLGHQTKQSKMEGEPVVADFEEYMILPD